MRDRIIIADKIISKSECDYLIQLFENNPQYHRPYIEYTSMVIPPSRNRWLQDILSEVISAVDYEIVIEWCEIAKRPPGSGHPKHFDITSDKTIFTSVTYLNNDFNGGRTYIIDDVINYKGFEIPPKIGRTLYFDGKCYEHGVTTVTDGDRYTLAIWYEHDKNQ